MQVILQDWLILGNKHWPVSFTVLTHLTWTGSIVVDRSAEGGAFSPFSISAYSGRLASVFRVFFKWSYLVPDTFLAPTLLGFHAIRGDPKVWHRQTAHHRLVSQCRASMSHECRLRKSNPTTREIAKKKTKARVWRKADRAAGVSLPRCPPLL